MPTSTRSPPISPSRTCGWIAATSRSRSRRHWAAVSSTRRTPVRTRASPRPQKRLPPLRTERPFIALPGELKMSEINTPERETTQAPDAKPGAKSAAAPAQAVEANEPNTRKRKLLLSLLGAAVVVSAAAYGAYYMTYSRYHETTDDAYVSGNLVQLTPQVTGTVIAVNAD